MGRGDKYRYLAPKNNNINYAGSGNVGIGVENPLHKLDIQGNINVRDSDIFTNDVIVIKLKLLI